MILYTILAYVFTLVFGSIFAYYLLNPLGLLVYLLIWLDALVLPRFVVAETFGFELVSLSGIIAGLAFGPLIGFGFVLVGIPAIVTTLRSIASFSIQPVWPNFHVLAISLSAVTAGLLRSHIPLIPLVLISIIFKHFLVNMFNLRTDGEITFAASIINTVFTAAAIVLLNQMGIVNFLM